MNHLIHSPQNIAMVSAAKGKRVYKIKRIKADMGRRSNKKDRRNHLVYTLEYIIIHVQLMPWHACAPLPSVQGLLFSHSSASSITFRCSPLSTGCLCLKLDFHYQISNQVSRRPDWHDYCHTKFPLARDSSRPINSTSALSDLALCKPYRHILYC